jgi:hypothetical protein
MWVAPTTKLSVREGAVNGREIRLEKGQHGQIPLQPARGKRADHRDQRGYNSKESALNGIESVKKNAPDARVEDETDD